MSAVHLATAKGGENTTLQRITDNKITQIAHKATEIESFESQAAMKYQFLRRMIMNC